MVSIANAGRYEGECKFAHMDLKPYSEKVEDALATIGVEPENARCEGEGQWLVHRNAIEIYVDIWQPDEHQQWEYFKDDDPAAIFQVVSPVCFVPEDPALYQKFLEEILYMNFHMFYGSFTVNFQEKMAAIRFRRLLEGINRVEIIEPIEGIGFYSESLMPYLCEKYGAKKIQ